MTSQTRPKTIAIHVPVLAFFKNIYTTKLRTTLLVLLAILIGNTLHFHTRAIDAKATHALSVGFARLLHLIDALV